ncbi:MAG: BamA/TamA family outer membrane protein [Sorangiineae bacterium]|nr:BamA/TamA family outer membrane protein [Polyangiaceae bacterium]MEB2323491.1 BamA/TamA family outer membrane protein [Sorangiineae bacterium]
MRGIKRAVGLLVALAISRGAAAASPKWSPYELSTIERVLGTEHVELIDPDPDGKLIESIELAPLDVFDERDPIPDFVNVFHVTTRRRVVRRELLFGVGDRWSELAVAESARNLRALPQLSLVLIVPLRGSRPGRVRVLVVTRDVWSLRLSSNFGYAAGALTFLVVQPAEINLFGTHTTVGTLFTLRPDTYSFGGLFADPRIAGSGLQGGLSGNVIVNRETGRPEGSSGSFSYGKPLYSVESRWAWNAKAVWKTNIERYYIGSVPRTYDSPLTQDDDRIPYQYSADSWFGAYELTRSFGREFKHDVSVGAEAIRQRFRAEPTRGANPIAARDFAETEVPTSDTRLSPYLQVDTYTPRYLRVHDFNTLGLVEEYRLGHEVLSRVYPASREVGSSRNLLGTYLAVSYTMALGDGLARALAASRVEFASPDERDALFEARVRVVTPSFGVGRVVYDVEVANHYRNYLNERYTIGGNTRLRGYPSDRFRGEDLVAGTLEYRSLPVSILSAEVGGALFYDVGDAFDGFEALRPKQDVGVGLRVLFPQVDRIVLRADWGFPLTPGFDPLPGALFVTFGQAFPMPSILPPSSTRKRTDLDQ